VGRSQAKLQPPLASPRLWLVRICLDPDARGSRLRSASRATHSVIRSRAALNAAALVGADRRSK
jgi:hypothetical protein